MSLTPATTSISTVDEGQQFTDSVTYFSESAGAVDPETGESAPPVLTPVNITSVTSSVDDPGVTATISGNTVTISGAYTNAFPGKSFDYIPTGKPPSDIVTGVRYIDIPEKIKALISYHPAMTQSITVTYTVVTDSGTATILQTVMNNWDAGKALMQSALSRGVI